MSEERRAYPRVTCNLMPSDFRVQKNQELDATFFAQVKDISPLGVRLIIPRKIPLQSILRLSISLPTLSTPKFKNFNISLSVSWVHEMKTPRKFEVGGHFQDINDEVKKLVLNFYLNKNPDLKKTS